MFCATWAPVRRFTGCAALLLSVLWCGAVAGDEPQNSRPVGETRALRGLFDRLRQRINPVAPQGPLSSDRQTDGQTRLVLCLSQEFFSSLMDPAVARQMPVQDVVLGTPVAGHAWTEARPTINLVPEDSQAVFDVVLEGTTVSRTTGRNRAAIIHSRATTTFRATKQIVFEPGSGFRASPATVHARTQLVTEGIDSTRGRLLGRLIRRRAWQEVQRKHAQAEAIAQSKAQARIQALFDDQLEEKLARLNRASDLRSALAAVLPRDRQLGVVCCSTKDSVQIAFSRDGDSKLPVMLPNAPRAAGPMQLWIHSSLFALLNDRITDRFPWAGNLLAMSRAATAAALANRLVTVLIGDDSLLKVLSAGEWVVVPLSGGSEEPRVVRRQ